MLSFTVGLVRGHRGHVQGIRYRGYSTGIAWYCPMVCYGIVLCIAWCIAWCMLWCMLWYAGVYAGVCIVLWFNTARGYNTLHYTSIHHTYRVLYPTLHTPCYYGIGMVCMYMVCSVCVCVCMCQYAGFYCVYSTRVCMLCMCVQLCMYAWCIACGILVYSIGMYISPALYIPSIHQHMRLRIESIIHSSISCYV